VEENSFLPELLFEQPILGAEVIDGVLISTIDPAAEDHKQQLLWLQEGLLLQDSRVENRRIQDPW
jgi:hypothetical protein